MQDSGKIDAWLQTPDGVEWPIHGACFIGRGNVNTLVLHDNRVSARHAMIHSPSPGEFWVIDLGSRNGTYVNGRLANQPRHLEDKDEIDFPGCRMTFYHPTGPTADKRTTVTAQKTIQDIKNLKCWLLVADIEAYTQFIQRSSPVEVAEVTGTWLADCKRMIEEKGGVMNKTLGDGFLAFWLEHPSVVDRMASALNELKQLQARECPRFRVVVHYGEVYIGGAATSGEESILGAEVNFVFRMEKLASSLGTRNLLSQVAYERIRSIIPSVEEYKHGLSGFKGEFQFYSY